MVLNGLYHIWSLEIVVKCLRWCRPVYIFCICQLLIMTFWQFLHLLEEGILRRSNAFRATMSKQSACVNLWIYFLLCYWFMTSWRNMNMYLFTLDRSSKKGWSNNLHKSNLKNWQVCWAYCRVEVRSYLWVNDWLGGGSFIKNPTPAMTRTPICVPGTPCTTCKQPGWWESLFFPQESLLLT